MVISTQINYEGQNLQFQDFSGQTLTNANFKDANLNSADFSNATLTGADFSGSDLDGASFENAVITGVNFSNTNVASAYFGGVTSGGITGTPSSINNYKLIEGYIVGAAAGTGDVKLSDAVFEGTASKLLDFTNTTFQDGDLTGVQFTYVDFTGATFTNTNLTNTAFNNVTFNGITSGGITGAPSTLPNVYKIVSGYILAPNSNLMTANLAGADLSNMDLSGANFRYGSLTGANLSNTNLTGANLSNTTMTGIIGEPQALPSGYLLIDGSIVLSNSDEAVVEEIFNQITSRTTVPSDLKGTKVTFNPASKILPTADTKYATRTDTVTVTVSKGSETETKTFSETVSADLTNQTLTEGFNFNGIDLTGAIFSGATLKGADFTNANVINASFTSATLTGATFTGTTMTGADLTSAILREVISGTIIGTPTLPTGYNLVKETIIGTAVNLTSADLSGQDLTGVVLTDATLTNANLENATLINATLTNATLTGATLTGATLTGLKSGNIQGTPASLPTDYKLALETIVGPNVDLTGANLENENLMKMNLTGVNFTNANLTGVNFILADLTDATLTGATLTGADGPVRIGTHYPLYFTQADATEASSTSSSHMHTLLGYDFYMPDPHRTFNNDDWKTDLQYAYLEGANFSGVNLTGVNFTRANLGDANLTNANLTNANLTNANLNSANITGATLTGATLTGATLTSTTMTGIIGTPQALPTGYQLVGGSIVLITNEDEEDVDDILSRIQSRIVPSDLVLGTTVTFDPASKKVPSAETKYATETYTVTVTVSKGSVSKTTTFQETVNANLTDADLTGFNFTGVNLTDANFTNATLTNATLTNANFTDAILTRVKSGGIIGTPQTLPTNYILVKGYIIGRNVDLTGADLSGADLTDANLTSADLANANLTGATLTGATLTGATLTGATMTGIIGTPQALPDGYEMLDQAIVFTSNITADVNIVLNQIFADRRVPSDLRGTTVTFDPASKKVPTQATKYATETYTVTVTVSKGSVSNTTTFQETVSANLTGADLTGFDFTNVNLTDANFTNVNFTNVTFTGATLTNANFTGATFTGVISGNIQGTPQTLPSNYKVANGYIVGLNVNLTGATLTGANLSNVNLTGATLTGATMTGIVGTPQALPQGYEFVDQAIVLTSDTTTVVDIILSQINSRTLPSDLMGATVTFDPASKKVPSAETKYATETYTVLVTVIKGSISKGKTFQETGSANLSGADLTGFDFSGVNLTGANFTNANFTNANLTNATLTNANFTGATFTGVKSGSIIGTPQTLPTNYRVVKGYLIGPGVNLTDAILTNANLRNANFKNATLTGVKSGGIQGTPQTLPTNYKIVNGYIVGPGVNLTGANLSGTYLTSANLTNVNLTDANLKNADLEYANIEGANLTNANLTDANFFLLKSGGIIGTPQSLPNNYKLVGGHIIGATVDLRNADLNLLKGADLEDMNLRAILLPENFSLEGANLENAQLTGRLNKVNLTNANLTNAKLNGNKQYSNQMQFPDGDISYIINTFQENDVWQVNYQQQVPYYSIANLSGANLTGAILTGANLTDATMTDIVGTPQALPDGYEMLDQAIVLTSNLRADVNAVYNEIYTKIRSPNFPNDRTLMPKILRGTTVTFDPAEKVPSAETKYATETYTVTITVSKGSVRKETRYQETVTANLTGKDLTGFDFSGANLTNVNFTNANLTNANFTNANFTNANFTNANFTNANLTNISGRIQGTPQTLPTNYKVVKTRSTISPGNYLLYIIGPNVNLTGADLETRDLTGADFSGANLSNATLYSANLTNANLTNANLSGANLSLANFTNIKSEGIIGTPRSITTNYRVVNGYLMGPNIDLTGANLKDVDIPSMYLSLKGANLTRADLRNADLRNVHLEGANLTDVNLTGANLNTIPTGTLTGQNAIDIPSGGYTILTHANLTRANLTDAKLKRAVLTNANLTNANLTDTDLTDATLTGVKSGSIIGTPQTLPTNYKVVKGYLIGRNVDLTGADLSNANLRNADLFSTNLTNVNLSNANLSNAILTNANLTNANLTNANLRRADLTNANLTNANLTDTDLTDATLTGVKSGSIQGTPQTLPTNYKIVNGHIFGPNVNLYGANFSNVDFSNVDLSNADLSNANLSNANLSNANLTRANLTNTNLRAHLKNIKSESIIGTPKSISPNYKIVNGYIIGPNADLSNADYSDLSNANLTGMNLTGVNLTGMRLTDANFTNAILTNANLTDANFTNANLTNANLYGVNLTNTYLYSVDIENWTGVKSGNIHFNSEKPPTLPESHKIIKQYIIGNYVNLSYADLMDADLSNVSLIRTNLTNARLDRAYLNRAKLIGANLTKARFDSANLTNANLTNANLSGAIFIYAILTNANFQDTTLSKNTRASNVVSVPRNLPSYADVTSTIITRTHRVRTCTKYLMASGPDPVSCKTEDRTETRTYYNIRVKTGSEKTGSGRVADGYVNSAPGGLFDINDTTNAIERFITDENGNYDLFTPISELPEVYVIIIQPGGIDTSTSSVVTTTMSSTSTRKQAEASAVPILHVTPVTTIVTNIIQKADTIDETTVSSAMEQVATKLNISEESIRSDFIADQNSDVAKIVQQIETTVNSMTPALNNTEITEDVVINNISLAIMESDTTFDFSNSNDINKIITNIENSAETITIDESVKSNTSNFITVANTLISDIDTATQTFDDVFTRATQITVASTITANTTGENFTFGFTSPVEPPTISEITSIPITIPAPSFITNICFPGNTPIETDDGYITIKKLVPGHHTIRGQRIVGITKTIAPDEHLICFEKDALGKNVPSQRTLMSKEHKIYYKNKLQEARDFLEDFDLVSKSKYSGEPLYNVLLEYHGIMIVNNMPCETLHPNSLSAKLYTSIRYSSSVREQILAMIHRAIQNKDYKTYRKIMKRI